MYFSMDGDSKTQVETTITEILDDRSFKIVENIEKSMEKAFVYGIEVKDFHRVNYQDINILTLSALRELDKEHKETKRRLEELEKKI